MLVGTFVQVVSAGEMFLFYMFCSTPAVATLLIILTKYMNLYDFKRESHSIVTNILQQTRPNHKFSFEILTKNLLITDYIDGE